MKVSKGCKGQSQPEIVAGIRLLNSLNGSGITSIFIPGFDCDSCGPLQLNRWLDSPVNNTGFLRTREFGQVLGDSRSKGHQQNQRGRRGMAGCDLSSPLFT